MEFEDYNETSKAYVTARMAIGSDIIIKELGPDAKSLTVLDAGCGTGNYAVVIADHVKSINCFDFNEGMLFQAKQLNAEKANVLDF